MTSVDQSRSDIIKATSEKSPPGPASQVCETYFRHLDDDEPHQ